MNWSPRLTSPWSPADLESILEDALKVLQQIGVECTHPAAREALSGWPGASVGGERIYFAPANVRDHWLKKRAQARPAPKEDTRFTLGGCWAGLFYCDPDTQAIRPATSADVALMCAALGCARNLWRRAGAARRRAARRWSRWPPSASP